MTIYFIKTITRRIAGVTALVSAAFLASACSSSPSSHSGLRKAPSVLSEHHVVHGSMRPSSAHSLPIGTKTTRSATYHVKKGDTLYSIARRNGTKVAILARHNGITNLAKIRTGQLLRIPN